MSRYLFSRRLLSIVMALGFIPVATDLASAAAPKLPQFPAAPTPATLNNGSLKTSVNPGFLDPKTGLPVPGQLPFSQIAAINEDLRLVCNGVPIQPSRLTVAMDGFPGGGQVLIQANPGYPACLALNPNCQPFSIITTGNAVAAPTGTITVEPWFPISAAIYQINGVAGGRGPRANKAAAPLMEEPGNTGNQVPQGATGCCGSPLGMASRPPSSAAQSFFSFPAYNAVYGPGLASNYFGTMAGRMPFFGTSSADAPGVSTYTPFGVNPDASESDPDKKEPAKGNEKPAGNP